MNWGFLLVVAAVVAVVLLLKKSGEISASAAQMYLKQGAVVIDVRSPAEFSSCHLPGVINIPLDQIESALPAQVSDKSRAILLHCASGMRSSIARKQLQRMGYAKAFNLGAYSRAEAILKTTR